MNRPHGPRTLAGRIVATSVLVALASVAVTGIATFGLYRQGATHAARIALARDADTIAATTTNIDRRRAGQARRIQSASLRKLLTSRQITLVEIDPGDDAATELGAPFTTADLTVLRQDGSLSTQRSSGGDAFLIEGRLSGDTALLMAQPVTEAVAQSGLSSDRLVIPLLLGLLGGALAGLVMARQIGAPLGRLSAAARRLSGGDRQVRVPPGDGPREVADVAQALNGLAAALADSEARQRRFLMNVSHELRTPLTAVTGYAEGLADGVITGAEVPAAAAVIRDEAARLDHRVDDLLALARMEADDFRLRIAPADLAVLVQAAGRAWQPRAAAAGVRLELWTTDPVPVDTDAERVRQAIDALADNALRVLAPGDTLVFGCGSDGVTAWVEVRDDGPGLNPEDLDVAFERGHLTERYRGERPVGSGLGLALVGELARRLGGHALARAVDGGGVSFVVVVPVLS